MQNQFEGFWFPASVREAIITPDRAFQYLHFQGGNQVPEGTADAVTVRWPRLNLDDWQRALDILQENRTDAQDENWSERLPRAMGRLQAIWESRDHPLRQSALEALETCTGHSVGMLNVALSLLSLIAIEELQKAASCQLTNTVRDGFVSLNGLPGRVRFFTDGTVSGPAVRALLRFDAYRHRAFRAGQQPADMMLGYAAGNVPGTGLLLALLGLAAAATDRPPVILIRNSRREPIFTSLVLSVLEAVDPSLLDTTMVTIWDHGDMAVQEYLVAQSDLVIAAASDETINELGGIVSRVSTAAHPIRFHGHGHKVSFSTIGLEALGRERRLPNGDLPLMDAVACLASLDVALWNQQGCLSSRVHFVEETGEPGHHSPEDYAQAVVRSLRELDRAMPKAIRRRRQIHNLFDQYQAVAVSNPLQVLSEYDDDFLVILDRRELTGEQFRELVNACQARTVAIVPVENVLEVPNRYLQQIGSHHLQSMSVALGNPDAGGLSPRLLSYAGALGAAGVTSIRTVGRGAFPQLAYSWDGLLPLDLSVRRQRGHFTAIEFGEPWLQIYETYGMMKRAMNASVQEP